jgi:hypothetical protein
VQLGEQAKNLLGKQKVPQMCHVRRAACGVQNRKASCKKSAEHYQQMLFTGNINVAIQFELSRENYNVCRFCHYCCRLSGCCSFSFLLLLLEQQQKREQKTETETTNREGHEQPRGQVQGRGHGNARRLETNRFGAAADGRGGHEDKDDMSRIQQMEDLETLALLNEVCDELEEEEDAEVAAAAEKTGKRIWAKDYLQKRDQLDG